MRFSDMIMIHAPIERVWALTVDVESWPQTTPTMSSVERLDTGPIAVGSTARVKQPAQRPKVWTVTAVEPPTRFAWASRVFGTDATATHELREVDGGTACTLTVEMEGRLAWFVGRLAGGQIRKALEQENAGFKRAAEAG